MLRSVTSATAVQRKLTTLNDVTAVTSPVIAPGNKLAIDSVTPRSGPSSVATENLVRAVRDPGLPRLTHERRAHQRRRRPARGRRRLQSQQSRRHRRRAHHDLRLRRIHPPRRRDHQVHRLRARHRRRDRRLRRPQDAHPRAHGDPRQAGVDDARMARPRRAYVDTEGTRLEHQPISARA